MEKEREILYLESKTVVYGWSWWERRWHEVYAVENCPLSQWLEQLFFSTFLVTLGGVEMAQENLQVLKL